MSDRHDDKDEPIHLDDWDPPDTEEFDDDHDEAFIAAVEAKVATLRNLYVESPRDHVLATQFERLLVERDAGVEIRRWAGIVVKAYSGAGKTRMLKRFLGQHPRVHGFGNADADPDFVHIDVPSPVTNKSLGLEVLRTMYPQGRSAVELGKPSRKADAGVSDIWTEVRNMAAEAGVWGLWIDEAHDLRNGGPMMHDILQSTIKRWMAHEHRPIIILSGTPNVEDIFLTREFRRRFLTVESPPLSVGVDTPHVRQMIAKYLRAADLGVDKSLRDFMPRLLHAGTYQLGWTLNVVIEAIRVSLLEKAERLSIEHFAESYAEIVQCEDQNNPFTANDWSGIDTAMHRGRQPAEKKSRRRSPKREETPW
ncbi:MAG: ATP-binding protein [Devosia sp.]|uniref:ATP-binding protein n=1 Tax=Devosia sp. TaxID=1871048 RepID=UPI001A3EE5F8|nr:ATP-binding protein [Devosia sp.]MBL8597775.1 ATP-binding protein [Devosia sp.]